MKIQFSKTYSFCQNYTIFVEFYDGKLCIWGNFLITATAALCVRLLTIVEFYNGLSDTLLCLELPVLWLFVKITRYLFSFMMESCVFGGFV